jgi:class 3 adenylate cyclase
MPSCPRCGEKNPDRARFCLACGAALEPVSAREERKVVSVLFADLVEWTVRAQGLDPEDVRELQDGYWRRLRTDLERYGGTVEKYIGDAVVALFGAPRAHEDDAERAVRAALAIRDWAREQRTFKLRIGVATGEALVRLGVQPLAGEGMAAGDVMNTVSRIQAEAAGNGILVDESTYRATRHAIDYEDHEPIDAKGKPTPLAVWEPLDARARFGVDVAPSARAPLAGRERELDLLLSAVARAEEESTPQLVRQSAARRVNLSDCRALLRTSRDGFHLAQRPANDW